MRKFVPGFIFNIYHFLLAFIGAVIYGFPSKKLIVIGVTGTNGKSTVVHLVTEILEQSGFKTASLSSIKFKIGEKEWKNILKMTMPGRFKLHKFLRDAIKAGCKYAVLEITSEGIKQHRHRLIDFNGAVFTNLTKEHLEAHGSFENYKKAKGKLFKALKKGKKKDKFVVVNVDDKYGEHFAKLAGPASRQGRPVKKYTYGINNKKAEKLLPKAYKAIDKAVKTGIIKKNTAARKKSRLTKLVNKVGSASSADKSKVLPQKVPKQS